MIKNKIKLIFYTVISFGLIWIKWKKQAKKPANTFFQLDYLPFKLDDVIKSLGGKKNIIDLDLKPSRVNLHIKNSKIVNTEELKNTKGITGVFLKSNSISLILGEFSKIFYEIVLKEVRDAK
ncbi:PTS sugar transporter subunit IIABC [Mycoplasma sp. CSL10137]|uniref:PTS sugar transporter subunit IIABC n=1 Tax=unclassified Mycoplasma TaxID=2683645 RepID=UPI00197C3222|nr:MULTISPECIES: PTS sugar transporter subunit IIABC [unclassified Mycoplasma]MBN4083361.1 PTS sugar transporter subunit IIABC [Mycoplasma sp. CSL10137]MBN4084337.1 PTS sugar transporter subunit IIABC [Mycoplasma sp. CSL10166]MBU4692823.1 PTS sugar transporter subunit IIABC [Mycoplasma sp. CSL7491-lung]